MYKLPSLPLPSLPPPSPHTHSQLVNMQSYSVLVFGQLVVVNMALNQTWTALLIALICSFPDKAIRLSPVISSVAGFTSGFFIPVRNIPWP